MYFWSTEWYSLTMKDFKNNRRFEGGGRDGGRPSYGGGQDRDRQMFKATCAKCGKTCEVPFRPNGEKPVYCNDCFVPQGPVHEKSERSFGGRPAFQPRLDTQSVQPRDDRSSEDVKRALFDINYKLDKLVTLMTNQATTSKIKSVDSESKKSPDLKELKKTLTKAMLPKKDTKAKKVSKKK